MGIQTEGPTWQGPVIVELADIEVQTEHMPNVDQKTQTTLPPASSASSRSRSQLERLNLGPHKQFL